jgi:hypothetical protein
VVGDGIQLIDASGRRRGWRRPVAIPDDIDHPTLTKAHGVVELPVHVYWSSPEGVWDLDDERQRIQVYQLVLTEGTDDDVRLFIKLDELLSLWPRLYLSPYVRQAWCDFLLARGIEVGC